MHRRQPIPRLWLMTDERQGDALWRALARLPAGGGVVFRHYALPADERAQLYARVARIARRRRLVLILAGTAIRGARPAGHHHRRARGADRARSISSTSAHDARALAGAAREGFDLAFVSPLHPTRSHPGARALGAHRFAGLVRGARLPVIALGGMNLRRGRHATALGAHGWAAIDAWSG